MPRTQSESAIKSSSRHKKNRNGNNLRLQRPTSKDLDLLLLAGCSCLMTILYHPVAEALQTSSSNPNTAIATQVQPSKTATNPMNAFHLVLPGSREQSLEEEEA